MTFLGEDALDETKQETASKVPEVTLLFWIMKILATTLGETGGDAVSMSMNLGYLVGTGDIWGSIFIYGDGPSFGKEISSSYLLDDHYCNDNDRNDHGGFCGPFTSYRLCGRNNNFIHTSHDVTVRLV